MVVPIDTALLQRYVGEYIIPNVPIATKLELFTKAGKLFCRFENSTVETELKPESPTEFFNDQASDLQLAFEADISRKTPIAYFIVSGMKKEMKKIIRIVK